MQGRKMKMSNIDEKLAKSLTAESTELLPYLPYLLQDLWELGSSPEDMIDLIVKHIPVSEKTKVLDLACGKGAVSVKIACALGCNVTGIDLMPEFIEFADQKAREYEVENLCEFKVADITETIKDEKDYDIVILGAVGDVLGNPEETVTKLKKMVKKSGFIIIDDAYARHDANPKYHTKDQWFEAFNTARVKLIDAKLIEEDEMTSINDEQQALIINRAAELKNAYPEQSHLFESYLQSQQAECDELENEVFGVTLLLQVMP
jgi:2-polyprenyl-3-methyl-5-hydroxy-6-metoxy-1,4-benzoquinol methylase